MLIPGVILLAFLPVYWLIIPARFRPSAVLVASVLAVGKLFPGSLLVLGVLTILTYAAVRLQRPAPLLMVGIAGLAVLVLEKAGVMVGLIGISYGVFRLISVSIEASRGKLEPPNLGEFLTYQFFAPAFLSGPIARYDRFLSARHFGQLGVDGAFRSFGRILIGLVKKVALVTPLGEYTTSSFQIGAPHSVWEAWLALLAYAFLVYLDFSSYCDIALGVAGLFGVTLPENFDFPYLANNITEFWRRWHITLSDWLRDYVYLPLSAALIRTPLGTRPLLVGCSAVTLTMVICGVWHGAAPHFACWGLGHGVLCSIHLLYKQLVLGQMGAKRRRALQANSAYRIAATLLTFVSVCILWLPFALPAGAALRYAGYLVGHF